MTYMLYLSSYTDNTNILLLVRTSNKVIETIVGTVTFIIHYTFNARIILQTDASKKVRVR